MEARRLLAVRPWSSFGTTVNAQRVPVKPAVFEA